MDPTRMPRLFWTVSGAALWVLVVWGNRIGLITSAETENAWAIARIVGSLLTAALLGLVAWQIRRSGSLSRFARIVLVAFLGWNLAVWVPSLIDVVPGDYSIPFKIVHIILAGVSIAFGALLAVAAWRASRSMEGTR